MAKAVYMKDYREVLTHSLICKMLNYNPDTGEIKSNTLSLDDEELIKAFGRGVVGIKIYNSRNSDEAIGTKHKNKAGNFYLKMSTQVGG